MRKSSPSEANISCGHSLTTNLSAANGNASPLPTSRGLGHKLTAERGQAAMLAFHSVLFFARMWRRPVPIPGMSSRANAKNANHRPPTLRVQVGWRSSCFRSDDAPSPIRLQFRQPPPSRLPLSLWFGFDNIPPYQPPCHARLLKPCHLARRLPKQHFVTLRR